MSAEIKSEVRNFLSTALPGDIGSIKDDTRLISTRLIDSIVALRLVSFLEEKFEIEFAAHEVTQENLDSIDIIAGFVRSKMK